MKAPAAGRPPGSGHQPAGRNPERLGAPSRRLDARRNTRAILRAAVRELADDPKVSMSAIAERSGLGRATVYRHFRSREELVEAIHRRALDDAEKAIALSRPQEGPAPKALERLVEALLDVGDRYRIAVDLHASDPALRRRERMLALPIAALVERGQAAGELRADIPADWVPQALGGLLAAALRASREGLIARDQAARYVLAMLIEGVAAGCGSRASPPRSCGAS